MFVVVAVVVVEAVGAAVVVVEAVGAAVVVVEAVGVVVGWVVGGDMNYKEDRSMRVYGLFHFKLNFEKKSSLLFSNRGDLKDLKQATRFSTYDGVRISL